MPQPSASIPSAHITQVAIVVRDIDRARQAYADIFGVPVPEVILTDGVDKANTRYKGEPTDARAKLAFIPMGSLQLELIEPVGGPSTWQEFLDQHGEGIHHIAFHIEGMDEVLLTLQGRGVPTVQRGDYTGGRYAYVDGVAAGLGAVIELLSNDGE